MGAKRKIPEVGDRKFRDQLLAIKKKQESNYSFNW